MARVDTGILQRIAGALVRPAESGQGGHGQLLGALRDGRRPRLEAGHLRGRLGGQIAVDHHTEHDRIIRVPVPVDCRGHLWIVQVAVSPPSKWIRCGSPSVKRT